MGWSRRRVDRDREGEGDGVVKVVGKSGEGGVGVVDGSGWGGREIRKEYIVGNEMWIVEGVWMVWWVRSGDGMVVEWDFYRVEVGLRVVLHRGGEEGCRREHSDMNIDTYTPTYNNTYMHTYIHTYTHTDMHINTFTTHTYIHTFTHIHISAHT